MHHKYLRAAREMRVSASLRMEEALSHSESVVADPSNVCGLWWSALFRSLTRCGHAAIHLEEALIRDVTTAVISGEQAYRYSL